MRSTTSLTTCPDRSPTILVENLGKSFSRYHATKPTTVMEAVLSGFRRIKPLDSFWALRGVSFEVAAGEMLGILGHNGAGKSTLLQLLGKVAHPTEGRIKTRGRIGGLLDLGAGFHGDLTGQENVFINAIVAGLSRKEVARRFDDIVEFAGLADFIGNPVRTYSTGMMMRLAFAVAVNTDPDILLVDEFLSVGDVAFQSKCLARIKEMKNRGCSIVLISHEPSQIEELCDRAIWLKHGNIMAYGDPIVVAGQYISEMRIQTEKRTPSLVPTLTKNGQELKVRENRFGSLEAEITDVRLWPGRVLKTGNKLCVELDYKTNKHIQDAIFSITISKEDGTICVSTDTLEMGYSSLQLPGKGTVKFILERLDLCAGDYFVDVGMYQPDWSYAYDYHWHVYPLTIHSVVQSKGVIQPPVRIETSALEVLVSRL